VDGVRTDMRSEGKEIDAEKKEKKMRKDAIRHNLKRCLTTSNKEIIKIFMMKSFFLLRGKRI
jgi:hypothetical protein